MAWQKSEFTDLPGNAFRHRFNSLDRPEFIALWRQFQIWRKNNHSENLKEFEEFLRQSQERVKLLVESLPRQLPNGRKGEFYKTIFYLPDGVSVTALQHPRAMGLMAFTSPDRPNLVCVIGVPKQAGETDILFKYVGPGYCPIFRQFIGRLRLTINPDPRELWQNIPTSVDMEYYKSETDGMIFHAGGKLMLAASRRGRAHAHRGLPRDDDFALWWDRDTGWYCMAVADGAGSAPYSRKGSDIACKAVIESLGAHLDAASQLDNILKSLPAPVADERQIVELKKIAYHLLPQAALDAYKSVRSEAMARGRKPRDYATTLLLAMVKFYPAGCAIFSFQIGDGCMGAITGCEARLLADPDEGEFGGQTRFITMEEMFEPKNLMNRLKFNFFPQLRALLLMTDGVSDARFSSVKDMRDGVRWLELWEEIKVIAAGAAPLEKLLAWLEFWSPGNHDDRTIAILAG